MNMTNKFLRDFIESAAREKRVSVRVREVDGSLWLEDPGHNGALELSERSSRAAWDLLSVLQERQARRQSIGYQEFTLVHQVRDMGRRSGRRWKVIH